MQYDIFFSNCIRYKVSDEITYSFPIVNGCTVEVLERISLQQMHCWSLE